jgi:hypothetical protein
VKRSMWAAATTATSTTRPMRAGRERAGMSARP